jgi:hypothetical protein
MGKRKWANICNLYCPPVRPHSTSQDTCLATEIIPLSRDSIILGDFNAHSPIWDHSQPYDARGHAVEDWIIENDLSILNDGRATRINRAMADLEPEEMEHAAGEPADEDEIAEEEEIQPQRSGESAPDLSLCGETWNGKCTWDPVECIGSSDHTPIAITISSDVTHLSVFQGQARWKSSNVNWQAWQDEVKENMEQLEGDDVPKLAQDFNRILIKAAEKHIGKVKPGKKTKVWYTPTVRGAIRKRNRLRHQVRTQRREWIAACREAQEEIQKAKEESWKNLLDDAITSSDEQQMWRLIKSLQGCPDTNSPNEAMHHKGKLITSSRRKADIFVSHYATVSDPAMSSDDRETNRKLKKTLRQLREQRANNLENVEDFNMAELKKAIKRMKLKGSP